VNTAEFIAQFEGCERKGSDGLIYPYLDAVNVPTIGYGHVISSMGEAPITPLEALNILVADVGYFENEVLKLSPHLEGNRLAAITSFAFNLGVNAYKNSTLRKRVDACDWDSAQMEIRRWNKAGGRVLNGLTRRRSAEAELLKETT
jgi:lysozyme